MPPRTRTQTPAGRRPKVAGLRDPRRQNDADEAAPTDAPADDTTASATVEPAHPGPSKPGATADDVASAAEASARTRKDTPTSSRAPAGAGGVPEAGSQNDATAGRSTAPPEAGSQNDATAGRSTAPPKAGSQNDATATADLATTTAGGPQDVGPQDGGARTGRPAAPARAAAPTPAGGAAGGRLRPSAGPGTATLERPAPAAAPASAPQQERPGRLGALSGSAAPALERFGASKALPLTLVVVILVCAVLAGLAFWQGRKAWTDGPVANQAVVDVGGTAELVGQSRQAVEQIFSYDSAKLDDSVNAARDLSSGQFTQQYVDVFERTIRGPAAQQQLRQTATVLNIGVRRMAGDRATVMALVQFQAERTTTRQQTNAPGLLSLDMQRVDGRWKLAQLTPLTASS